MSERTQEELLRYYLGELTYLRRMGTAFADRYPKVANRLELGPDESADPHVERLLESFAFLTARIQRNLDQQFPEISTALLELLYPNYLCPIPSMSIARFEPDPEQGVLTTGYEIPRETPLYAEAVGTGGLRARFRTCFPTTLWPIEVVGASLESPRGWDVLDARPDVVAVLRIRLESSLALAELELSSLRFHIQHELRAASDLYELIFAYGRGALLIPEAGGGGEEAAEDVDRPPEAIDLGPDALAPVGFAPEEALLPTPPQAHPGYRLLQEYFAFPRKFLFFDVGGLDRELPGSSFELLILLGRSPESRIPVDRQTFALGCTPIVNLFPLTTEPIRLDHTQVEYRLVPDAHRAGSTEIHSVQAVSASKDAGDESVRLQPYYAFDHGSTVDRTEAFWVTRRVDTGRRELPGTEHMLSVVDLDFDPTIPGADTLFAHTLCTNRRLAEQLPAGSRLVTEIGGAPVRAIEALLKPTPQLGPPLGGETRWRLVSHLVLNQLSLKDGASGLDALRELLLLYADYDSKSAERQINGIREMHTRDVVERVGPDAWRGFARGTEVRLVFDRAAFSGSNPFVLASVLRHFFALYASVNSFVRLVVEDAGRPDEVWKKWPALAGTRDAL